MINLKKLTEKLWSQSVHNFGAVIGEIRWFAMSQPPTGWLVCNGAIVFTSNYPALFAAIGKTFTPQLISTDPDVENPEYSDPEVFRLPNLVGKVPWGSTSVGTALDAGLPNITGFVNNRLSVGIYGTREEGSLSGAFHTGATTSWFPARGNNTDGTQYLGFCFNASSSNPIYGRSDTVQPPALCLLPCIRYE